MGNERFLFLLHEELIVPFMLDELQFSEEYYRWRAEVNALAEFAVGLQV